MLSATLGITSLSTCMMKLTLLIEVVIFLENPMFCFITSNSVPPLFSPSYCLSLYGCLLWHLDSSSIEVAFKKVLRRIWRLSFNSHTIIVHCTVRLYSIYNFVYVQSCSLLHRALSCSSFPVSHVFRASPRLAYTFCRFNMCVLFWIFSSDVLQRGFHLFRHC